MLMALMVVLVFETKSPIFPHPQNVTILLYFMRFEEKNILAFEKMHPCMDFTSSSCKLFSIRHPKL
jgi:hypothetical protein